MLLHRVPTSDANAAAQNQDRQAHYKREELRSTPQRGGSSTARAGHRHGADDIDAAAPWPPAASPFYYELLPRFREMAITTGGADARNATGGVRSTSCCAGGRTCHTAACGTLRRNKRSGGATSLPTCRALGDTTGKRQSDRCISRLRLRSSAGPLLQDSVWVWARSGGRSISNAVNGEAETRRSRLRVQGRGHL